MPRGQYARKPVPHGTASRYTNQRCRCARCTRAWRDHHRDYVRRRKLGLTRPYVRAR